jgi:hypothetical protein
MADSRISGLTAGTPVGTSIIPYSDGIGTTLSTTVTALGGAITGAGAVTGQVIKVLSSGSVGVMDDDFGLSYVISTPGSAVLHPAVECGFAGTIESIRLYSGTTKGNGTIDIYKMTYAQAGTGTPGTAFSMIGTATKPSIAGTQVYEGTVFTGWTATTFSKGDWLIPYVVNSGTITALTVAISGRKTAVA